MYAYVHIYASHFSQKLLFSPPPHRAKREEDSSCFSLWVWVWLWRDALVSCREGGRARTDKKRTNLLLSASWPYLHPSHCVADVRQTTGTWLLPSMDLALLDSHLEELGLLHMLWTCSCMWQRSKLPSLATWDGFWSQLPICWDGLQSLLCGAALLPFLWVFHELLAKNGVRPDITESLTPVQLVLGVKGLPTGILFVLFSLLGSLAEAGKEGFYKQNIKTIVFWAMNRSGEVCFLSPICCIVDPFRQNKGLYKSQGPATWSGIVWI